MRLFIVLALALISVPIRADEPLLGHKLTAWERKEFQPHREAAMKMGQDYLAFLTQHKTEREVVAALLKLAKAQGFQDLFTRPQRLAPGDRRYAEAHAKILALAIVGKRPLTEGLHIIAAHIDAVRIDLKQKPLYADGNLALLETHYYGGIKNYQWLSHPLELRGVVIKKDGTRVDIALGQRPEDPVLVIPDVLVHLSSYVDDEEGEQVPAEHLDPVLASTPGAPSAAFRDPFAAEAARLLEARYGISPDDLATAELELVPALPARSVGLDSALVGGYGQDDRACSFAAARALLSIALAKQVPEHTAIVLFVDKEEVGSAGNTGARSNFLRRVVGELLEAQALPSTELAIDRALSKSVALSADVTSAAQPHYAMLHDRRNAAFLGSGVVWDDSGVHAELFAYLRGLLDRAGITHQTAMFTTAREGKGEGGTVLPFLTQHGMEGINVSIPLLSMHSPFELVSKADLFEGYRAYREFLLAK